MLDVTGNVYETKKITKRLRGASIDTHSTSRALREGYIIISLTFLFAVLIN